MKSFAAKIAFFAPVVALAVSLFSFGRATLAEGWPIYTKDNAPPAPKLEDLALQESATKDGVTWTFEKPARVGRFVNGDVYIVGEATIVKIDPPPLWGDQVTNINAYEKEKKRAVAELIRNGSLLDPAPTHSLTGFDSRSKNFTAKLRSRPPIAMKPGDVLVSTISEGDKMHGVSGGDSPIQSASLLTCLKEPVPADAFRPSYGDRSQSIYLARNLRRDLLLKLPVPPKPPDYKTLTRDFLTPWLEIDYYGISATRYQHSQYGRSVCQAGVEATLSLLLDYPPEEKEPLLIGYVQYGIDLYGLIKNGHPGWIGDGGWGAGRKWPMVFAGLMLDQADFAQVREKFPKAVVAEDTQVFRDDCWTGAGVCFAFDSVKGSRREGGWGPFENWHPTRWDSFHGQMYRSDMTGSTWVGQALMIHLMHAEGAWDGDVFLDYCDRWMYEPDPGFGSWTKQGEGYTRGGIWSWFKPMWDQYRMRPPAVAGKEIVPWPNTGWQRKNPPQDSDSVKVEIGKNREFIVKGQPFFPLMMFAETPARIPLAGNLGMNTIAEGNFLSVELPHATSNKAFMDEIAKAGLYGIFGADMRVAGHPALLGWIQPDDTDKVMGKPDKEWRDDFPGWQAFLFTTEKTAKIVAPHEFPASGYQWMKKVGPTRPVLLALSAGFMKGAGTADDATKAKEYPEFIKACDMAGFDIYPVTAGQAGGRPDAVAKAMTELRQLTGTDKPVFAWIEAAPKIGTVIRNNSDLRLQGKVKPIPDGAVAPTAAQTRAEVWMAIIGGATAIGYRGFEGFDDIKLDPAMIAELQRLNAQITRLAPALLADPAKAKIDIATDGKIVCHARATDFENATYIFAQMLESNPERAGNSGRATIRVADLKAGTKIEVVDENRILTAADGQFTDDFTPLAEHIYKIAH